MINYCIVLSSDAYLYVFEPFLRRRHLTMPVLFIENKVAIYIRRKSVVDLLFLMMKGEIDNNAEVVNAFHNKQIVERPYVLNNFNRVSSYIN